MVKTVHNKKTHEQFVKEMAERHPNIEILGPYINNKTKIKFRCLIHECEYEVRADHLLKHGCKVCNGNNKTHNMFIQEIKEISPKLIILDTYTNRRTKVKVECLECGNIFEMLPNLLCRGHGCKKCAHIQMTKTTQQFKQELYKVNPDIEIVGEYINNATHVTYKCLKDGFIGKAYPNKLLKGYSCEKCANSKYEEIINYR